MRSVLLVCVAMSLASCQGGAGAPWGVTPLAEPVTFGNTPIVNARAQDRETIVGYKQGFSGSITVDSYSRVAIQRAGDCLNLRSEVLNVETSFAQILESYQGLYRMEFAARAGRMVDYVADMEKGTASASVARKGSTPVESSDPSLIFNVLLEQLHLGGETVRQGEEVLRYRLGDLLPYLRGEDAERTYSLRIVGSSDHEGRPVVVARAEGYIWAADEPMSIDGTHYFDIETGVALYTNTQLHHVSGSDTNSRVRFVRNLELRPPRTAQAGSGEAKGLAWGECVNEI